LEANNIGKTIRIYTTCIGLVALLLVVSIAAWASLVPAELSVPPTVTINQAARQADPTGDTPIHFTVVFSKAVTGFAAGDVTLGGTAPGALTATVTGSGTTYDVAVSGMTGSGTVTADLAGDVARDAVGNGNKASTATDNTVTYRVVMSPLTVTINQAAGQADPTGVASARFTVVFSQTVFDFAAGDITLSGSAPSARVSRISRSGRFYDVTVSGMTGQGTVIATLKAGVAHSSDGDANMASTSTDNTVTYAIALAPLTATVNQASSQADPTNVALIHFTVVFNRAVTDFAAGDIAITGDAPGPRIKAVTGSGTTYDVAVTGMTGSGTVIANLAAGGVHDAAGNSNAASSSRDNTVTYVAPPLTVTLNQASTQADPTTVAPVRFTVVFSRPVTGFTAADVTLSSTAPGVLSKTVTGSGTTYEVAVSGMTGTGTITANLAANVAQDAIGNANTASTSVDNTVTFRVAVAVVPLTVTINQAVGQADPTQLAPIRFTVVFNKAVTDFSAGDVTLTGSAPGAQVSRLTGSGRVYEVSVSGMTGSGTVIAALRAGVARDASGNASRASTSVDNVVTFDATPLTATINQALGQRDPTNVAPVRFTVIFSRPVTDFSAADVTAGGTAPGVRVSRLTGSGRVYNVAVSGMTGSGTVLAALRAGVARDALGNASRASTSVDNVVTYDVTPLTATINQAVGQADPTRLAPIRFTVVFSKVVTDFSADDVTLAGSAPGARVSRLTGSGRVYEVSVSGMTGNGTVIAALRAGVARDALGNASRASTSVDNVVTFGVGVIVTPLTVTINQAAGQRDPANVAPVRFTVIFSRPVTDFTAADVTLSSTAPGVLTKTVTGSGTTYDVAVSGMTGTGTITANLAANVAQDAIGNTNTAATFTDNTVTFDVTVLTVTINQAAGQVDPTNVAPVRFTVVFSRPVTDFTAADVTLSGTAPGILTKTVTGSGTTYEVAVSGMTDTGTVTANLPARIAEDAVGNVNTASTSTDNTVTYDVTVLTATVNQAVGQPDPTNVSPIRFTVVFSRPVIDFTAADVTLSGTAPGILSRTVTGSGTTYDVAVSGMTGTGTVIATLAAGVARDAVGNANTASTSVDNVVVYDVTVLTATINQAVGQVDPTRVAPVRFTVVFSRPVTDFTAADVTLSSTAPGVLTKTVTGSGTTYDVAVSGMTGTGTITANLAANVAQDAIGNANAAATFTDNRVTFDVTSPALGAAATFGAFGDGAGITNQGVNTVINGDIGTTAASTTVTGFHDSTGDSYTETPMNIGNVTGRIFTAAPPPVVFAPGGPFGGNATTKARADAAAADALTAYNQLQGLPTTGPDPSVAGELSGLTLTPGVYKSAGGSFTIAPGGTLTLDAQGDPNAVWVFQMGSSLAVGAIGAGATPARVVFRNGVGQSANVYWAVGSSTTINTGAQMVGTIISQAGITFSTSGQVITTTLDGRALCLTASVTMVNTVINVP
jgi:nitrogen fixation protein FixH/predicted heme/steroid binding protein